MRIPGWLFIVGVVVLVAGTALCSVVTFTFARKAAVDLGNSGVQVVLQPTRTPAPTNTPAPPTATTRPGDTPVPTIPPPTATIDPLAAIPPLQDPRRINILLLGIDQRKGETGTFNTDTMIVFSVDPIRKTIGMLSIPRDLWVDIPGSKPSRINTANAVGQINAYPGGGPALSAATVTQNLGIKIDKYVLINFDVFTTLIDAIAPNGVQVCPQAMIDDPYYPDAGYGFIHVHFEAGCQRLDATHLLQYARTRHTPNSDFDRALRQQEVIKAVRDEVLNAGGIANLLTKAPQLWDELSGSYKTNLSLNEILQLASLAQQIPSGSIHSGQIGPAQTTPTTAIVGGIPSDVLILNHAGLDSLLQQVFNPPEDLSLAELRTRAQTENASVVVFNNSDTAGLAGQTRDWLASRQVTVADVGSIANWTNAPTTVRVYKSKPYTARYLAQLLSLPSDRIQTVSADGLTDADIMVAVGTDIQPLLSGQ